MTTDQNVLPLVETEAGLVPHPHEADARVWLNYVYGKNGLTGTETSARALRKYAATLAEPPQLKIGVKELSLGPDVQKTAGEFLRQFPHRARDFGGTIADRGMQGPLNPIHGWHAPAGGMLLKGTFYTAGQPIPDDQVGEFKHDDPKTWTLFDTLSKRNSPYGPTTDPDRAALLSVSNQQGPSIEVRRLMDFDLNSRYNDPLRPKTTLQDIPQDIYRELPPSLRNMTDTAVVKGLKVLSSIPPSDSLKALAKFGIYKSDWYTDFTRFLHQTFGLDDVTFKEVKENWNKYRGTTDGNNAVRMARFTGVLGATSPRFTVKDNLKIALGVYDAWERFRRANPKGTWDEFIPFADKTNVTIMDRSGNPVAVSLGKVITNKSVRQSIQNSLLYDDDRIMSFDHDKTLYGKGGKPGGPKTESFTANLLGLTRYGTLDRWHSYVLGTDQKNFAARKHNQSGELTDARYSLLEADLNRIGRELTVELQGKHGILEAAHVQAAIWCAFKGITELAAVQGISPTEATRQMTVGQLGAVAEFTQILHDVYVTNSGNEEENRAIRNNLARLGINSTSAKRIVEHDKKLTDWLAEWYVDRQFQDDPNKPLWNNLSPDDQASLDRHVRRFAGLNITSGLYVPRVAALHDKRVRKMARTLFTSPNQDVDLGFNEAVQRLRSANQKQYHQIASTLYRDLGVRNVKVHDAIGGWRDGAENSLVHVISEPMDHETARYIAAWFGLLTNQKSVLHFAEHDYGPDSLYEMDVPDGSLERVRQSLLSHDIDYHTMIPLHGTTKVLVYDPSRGLRSNVETFARSHNAAVRETVGTGQFVGSSGDTPSRTDARRVYRDIIADHEAERPHVGVSNDAQQGPSVPLARPTADRVKMANRPARRMYDPAPVPLTGDQPQWTPAERVVHPVDRKAPAPPPEPVTRTSSPEAKLRALVTKNRLRYHQGLQPGKVTARQAAAVLDQSEEWVREQWKRFHGDAPLPAQSVPDSERLAAWVARERETETGRDTDRAGQPSTVPVPVSRPVKPVTHDTLDKAVAGRKFPRTGELATPSTKDAPVNRVTPPSSIPVKFAAVKAPAGGLIDRGIFYKGGQVIATRFLPKEVTSR